MRPSRPRLPVLCPRLALRLGLLLLVGLSACGPAPSDHAPSLEPHASLGGPSESPPASQNSPSSHHAPVTPAASSLPLAAPLASNPAPAPDQQETPAPLPEQLVLPQWIAQALASPEVSVRLRALDLWAQQGPKAPLDPLIMALDDADDAVRTKAMAIIERHWAVAQKAEPAAAQ